MENTFSINNHVTGILFPCQVSLIFSLYNRILPPQQGLIIKRLMYVVILNNINKHIAIGCSWNTPIAPCCFSLFFFSNIIFILRIYTTYLHIRLHYCAFDQNKSYGVFLFRFYCYYYNKSISKMAENPQVVPAKFVYL